jgi:hypothetical protein
MTWFCAWASLLSISSTDFPSKALNHQLWDLYECNHARPMLWTHTNHKSGSDMPRFHHLQGETLLGCNCFDFTIINETILRRISEHISKFSPANRHKHGKSFSYASLCSHNAYLVSHLHHIWLLESTQFWIAPWVQCTEETGYCCCRKLNPWHIAFCQCAIPLSHSGPYSTPPTSPSHSSGRMVGLTLALFSEEVLPLLPLFTLTLSSFCCQPLCLTQ